MLFLQIHIFNLRLNEKEVDIVDVQIASGVHGIVYRGTYRRMNVAIKTYQRSLFAEMKEDQKKAALDEFRLMRDSWHANVVVVYGFIKYKGCLGLVMELAADGTLARLINVKMFRDNIWLQYQVLLQIAHAMDFLHGKDILHRDLKPDNVLLFSWSKSSIVVKVTDFGESRVGILCIQHSKCLLQNSILSVG